MSFHFLSIFITFSYLLYTLYYVFNRRTELRHLHLSTRVSKQFLTDFICEAHRALGEFFFHKILIF